MGRPGTQVMICLSIRWYCMIWVEIEVRIQDWIQGERERGEREGERGKETGRGSFYGQ